jgi:hypothetical protein
MKEAWLNFVGALLIIMFVYLFFVNVQNLESFTYSVFPINDSLVSSEDDIVLGISNALWDSRSLDILIFACLLFASSVCCASLLYSKKVEVEID